MTGKELMLYSMDLCGLLDENGEACNDTKDLQQRALSLINITLAENGILDCNIRKIKHSIPRIHRLDDPIDCSDVICYRVLPYGVARLMMLGEDDALAADFGRLYSQGQESAARFGKAVTHQIKEVY